jgi:transmembrane sensor
MKKEISAELIKRYLSGNCSEEEAKLVDEWYDSFEDEDGFIGSLSAENREEIGQELFKEIERKNHQQRQKPVTAIKGGTAEKYSSNAGKSYALYLKVAAVVIVVFGLAFLITHTDLTSAKQTPAEGSNKIALQHFTNTHTSLQKYVLPDGSTIWLHPRTTIEFPGNFNEKVREVSLRGEAFFDITKDSLRPFIIHSSKLTTKVLGTSFTIKAYEHDPHIEVSVLSGKVSLRIEEGPEPAGLILMANQKGVFSKAANQLQKEEIKPLLRQNVWAKTTISFDDTPISEVIRQLNEKFDAEIKIAGKPLNYTIKADFTNQNLPLIIDLICKSIEASYEINGKKITIQGEDCSTN